MEQHRMVEQNGFDNAFTTDEYWRLRQLLDEDAIRHLTLCYFHYPDHRYCERLRGVFTPDIVSCVNLALTFSRRAFSRRLVVTTPLICVATS